MRIENPLLALYRDGVFQSREDFSDSLEGGRSGINKSSSDDRPGPGICDSKYVEDAKAARSVRVWDRVPIK